MTLHEPVLQFLVSIFPLSVIVTWLNNSTRGSLPIAIIIHAVANTDHVPIGPAQSEL